MFKFIREMFSSGKVEEPLSLVAEDIPAVLEAREKEITHCLSKNTEINRQVVSNASAALSGLVQELVSLEREEANHPKLEKIARNTLPLFEKTMLSSLARVLPEEPEAFYHAASESLKGCVKGLAGPGRYLRGVFPDEMKEIREIVDRIGREINAMTPHIAKARKKREQVSALRKDLAGLSAALSERGSITTELSRIDAEIEREKRDIVILTDQEKEAHLAITSPDMTSLEQHAAELREAVLVEERAIRNDLSVISHLLRKSEKVLLKGESRSVVKDLELVIDAITVSDVPAEEQVIPGLVRVLPLIGSMIENGDIVLKNKEEKEIFSRNADIPARLSEYYRKRNLADSQLEAVEREIADNPVVVQVRRLEREKVRRETHLASLTGRRLGLLERADLLDEGIPATRKRVEQALSIIEERQITLREAVEA